ncbi:hypothetical protein KMZ32_11895 [Phycicoccus sp. MAQZ13P-2]|uniref:hypothetical protein n=1 Tax=Phycicoccus mangrovi TaxID=2840470 RepID=UPI001BFFFE1C|nr:hypothetical protein [Phycicoccus mangrovi]MBT9256664.1 hypothetical protein [Phycicoccus mangrovi]MBT9274772.1 hypothetical protein [Phycicoccus mangrovi]
MARLKTLAATLAAVTLGGLVTVATPSAAVAEDAMCRTTTGSSDFYPGPSASATYDETFHNSVAIPAGLLDGRYVPQGLAYWNDFRGTDDVLLISAYHDDNGNGTPDGPSAVFGVWLSGPDRGESLGRMLIPTTHAGGIAVAGGHVYVGGEGIVRYWSASGVRSVLLAANNNHTYTPKDDQNVAGKASFLGTQGGYVWTGDFSETSHQSMWRYRPNSDGSLTYTSTKRTVPAKTQGMTTVGSRFVFATSYGRNDRGNVWVRSTASAGDITDATSFCMRAPSMIEGLAYGSSNGNAHVWALYESGAYTYNKGLDDPRNPIRNIHWAEGSTLAGLYGQSD